MNSVDTGRCSVNGIRPEGLAGIVELTRAGDCAGAFHASDYHRLRVGKYRSCRADDDVITIERVGRVLERRAPAVLTCASCGTYAGWPPPFRAFALAYTQVNAAGQATTLIICKTVGSAYVGSNPTPATSKDPAQAVCARWSAYVLGPATKVAGRRCSYGGRRWGDGVVPSREMDGDVEVATSAARPIRGADLRERRSSGDDPPTSSIDPTPGAITV